MILILQEAPAEAPSSVTHSYEVYADSSSSEEDSENDGFEDMLFSASPVTSEDEEAPTPAYDSQLSLVPSITLRSKLNLFFRIY